jgi:hypothetical protein
MPFVAFVPGHAMRSALTPVAPQLGIDVGTLLGGVMVVETVSGMGGIGQDPVQAIGQGNLPLIIGMARTTPPTCANPAGFSFIGCQVPIKNGKFSISLNDFE